MNRNHHPALALAVAAVTGLGLGAYSVTAQDQSTGNPYGQERPQQQERTGQQAESADRETQKEKDKDKIKEARHDRQGQHASQPKLPQGVEEGDEADADEIRDFLRSVASAATNPGSFNDLGERFVDQDRNRFGEFVGNWFNQRDFDEFDAAAEQLADAFEQKYGEELDIDAEQAFADVQAVQGEVKEPEQVAANWPVTPTEGATSGSDIDSRARTAGSQIGGQEGAEGAPEGAQRPGQDPSEEDPEEIAGDEDSNIEEGRQIAVASVPGPKGKPALNASLVNEFPGTWKLDIPNDQEGEALYRKLTSRLQELATSADEWPEDAADAQKMIGYEVLATLYGVEADSGQGMQRGTEDRQDNLDRPDATQRPEDQSGEMPQ